MASFDEARFNTAKETAHRLYVSTGIIHSPLLGNVHFTADGFMHLIFKDPRHKRDWKNSIKRFQLLAEVKAILEGMGYCQEYQEQMEKVIVKEQKQRVETYKTVRYWGFVAVSKNYRNRLKVILKQIGNGQIIFWSVIPYWETKYYKDIRLQKLSEGDLAID